MKAKLGTKKQKSRSERTHDERESAGISLLEPMIREPVFENFTDLAKACDALIAEFYRYYRESPQDEPNMFGFVTVRHIVKFTDKAESIYTENIIGQRTNVIYAPVIEGETHEEQERRRLGLLAAFDHTKRASHILALTLLTGLLRGPGLRKLIEKQSNAATSRGAK